MKQVSEFLLLYAFTGNQQCRYGFSFVGVFFFHCLTKILLEKSKKKKDEAVVNALKNITDWWTSYFLPIHQEFPFNKFTFFCDSLYFFFLAFSVLG